MANHDNFNCEWTNFYGIMNGNGGFIGPILDVKGVFIIDRG